MSSIVPILRAGMVSATVGRNRSLDKLARLVETKG
jgi:hypothetical protein